MIGQIVAGELAKVLSSGEVIRCCGVDLILEPTQADLRSIDRDICTPRATPCFVPAHAFKSAGGAPTVDRSITSVLCPCSDTQIGPDVVERVPISMIYAHPIGRDENLILHINQASSTFSFARISDSVIALAIGNRTPPECTQPLMIQVIKLGVKTARQGEHLHAQ